MYNNPNICAQSCKTVLAAALSMAPALLQAQQGPGTSGAGALEEVVVTAQKRAQSLQDTPIAITAFGAHELEQKGIADITDLGNFAPNVKVAPMPTNTGKATIVIRGSVTSNPAITWEPTVGIYLDNVYVGKFSGNIFKIAELERMEVLRGPQGTLYGKNTIGGAVNLITAKPTGEFGGTVKLGAGNYDYREGYISLDTPALELGGLGDIKAKLSYTSEERDGFYDNIAPPANGSIAHPFVPGGRIQPNPRSENDDFNQLDRWIGRVDLLWDVNERLSVRYTLDEVDVENTSSKEQLTAVDPGNLGLGVPVPADLAQYVIDEDRNASKISTDNLAFEAYDSTSHSLFVDYSLGNLGPLGDVTLKYIGNHRELNFKQSDDNDGTPFSLFHSVIDEDYTQISHEFQLSGSTERTDYVVGLYSFEEDADVFNPLIPLNSIIGPLTLNNQYGLEAEQIAVYGQIEYRPPVLNDRLSVTGGVRWSREEKDSYIIHPGAFSTEADDQWTNVAPTLILGYDIRDHIRAYAKYAKGWKAGGFNGESETAAGFVEGYDPEEVDAYEVGVKSRWLDDTLQVNAALFYHDETDLQLSVFTSGSSAATVVRNAGSAVKHGAELEVLYRPIADLQLSANFGYLHSEYEEFEEFDQALGRVVDKKDEKDNQYAPNYNYNLSAEYTVVRADWGRVIGRLDYTYSDNYVPYVNPDQNATSQIDSYGVLNGRISVADIPLGTGSTLNIALWGKNLTDEEYRVNTIPFGPWTVSFFGDPRTYGLEATVTF